jgi:hypothetical protein
MHRREKRNDMRMTIRDFIDEYDGGVMGTVRGVSDYLVTSCYDVYEYLAASYETVCDYLTKPYGILVEVNGTFLPCLRLAGRYRSCQQATKAARKLQPQMPFENVEKLSEGESNEILAQMKTLTGLDNPNSTAALHAWLKERRYPYESVDSDHIAEGLLLSFIKPEAMTVLALKQKLGGYKKFHVKLIVSAG